MTRGERVYVGGLVVFLVLSIVIMGAYIAQSWSTLRVGPPFAYQISNVGPTTLCPGDELTYDVVISVNEYPITLNVSRTWVKMPEHKTVYREKTWHNYTGPIEAIFAIAQTVPPDMPLGPAEWRVVGSAIYYESTGYQIDVDIVECD